MTKPMMPWNEKNTKVNESHAPARFLRREWKHNKPHLQKSTSVPILSLLPTTRPHFTCQRCGFTNAQIPMCLWCCWTSKDAETTFEKSTPRARRVSAPMRVQGLLERRDENGGRVIDGTDASVMCRDDSSFSDRQDRGARRFGHITDCPGFGGTEVAEPATWGMIKGGPSGQSGNEVDHAPTWPSPGFQATDKRISSLRDAIGGIVGEGDLRQRGREWAEGCDIGDRAKLSRKEKPMSEPMSSMQSVTTPARRSGVKTIGDASANDNGVLVTMPTSKSKGRSLLPLRLRRLKGDATPLHIDSTVQPSLTSVISSTSPHVANDTAFTAPAAISPLPSPRTLRRKSHLKIFRSGCAQGGSPDIASGIRAVTGAEPSTRRPKSDPFGQILRLQNRTGMTSPSTPESAAQTPTRPRAATTSALNQTYFRSATHSTPALSIRSGLGSPTHPKPLYSVIRKNGVCLSPPPLSQPSPSFMTSGMASPGCSSGKVNEYGVGSGNGHTSPASSIFPLYPSETMLLSLSLDSRPSSSSSVSSSSARDDVFKPLSLLKAKCGYKARSKSRSNSRKRKHENSRPQQVQVSPTPNESAQTSTGVPGSPGMGSNLVYQRVFQVPFAGPGTGCSMSGETELKLALARHDRRPSISLSRETSPAGAASERHARSTAAGANEPRSPGSKPGKVMRRLREMVSRTFDAL